MYMVNVNPTITYPTQTIFHWLALGVAFGQQCSALDTQGFALGIQGFALGMQGFALGTQGFLDTNIIGVGKAKLSRCGSRSTRDPNAKGFHVAVEHSLKGYGKLTINRFTSCCCCLNMLKQT